MSTDTTSYPVKTARYRGGWRARTRVTHPGHPPVDLQATGKTRVAANSNLHAKREALLASYGHDTHTLGWAAQQWLERLGDGDLSPGSQRIYRSVCEGHVDKSPLARKQLSEIHPGEISDYLHSLGVKHGAGAAKTTRTVLSHIWKWAVRNGHANANPVRAAELSQTAIKRKRGEARERVRAFTVDEAEDVMAKLQADPLAERHDLYGLTLMLRGTGMRIGEALALRWEHLDMRRRYIHVPGTKTRSAPRTVNMPDEVHQWLAQQEWQDGWVFSSMTGTQRDASNTIRLISQAFKRYGYDWATSHVWRKTLATRMDEAGYSAREIADQLGHAKPSVTQDVYMGRSIGPDLHRLAVSASGSRHLQALTAS